MNDAEQEAQLHELLVRIERALHLVQQSAPSQHALVTIEVLLQETAEVMRTRLGIQPWPEPTTEPPDMETLQAWFFDSICEATDGCMVEHGGTCPHGHPSWFITLGLI